MKLSLSMAAVLAGLVTHGTCSLISKRAAIDDCLSEAGVPSDAQGSADWKADVRPFNLRLPYTPVAIAVPTTQQHVVDAVLCAARVGVKVNPKSGGHSYASFGLGGENGHLVIQLDRMSSVRLDNVTNIATVDAGTRLGRVATALYNQGRRGFSHGTCPGVGVGGHSLHGGFGFSSHTHGLAVDWIAGATVVLANGTVVELSETQNPDLFWAMRGAGSNFGIVVSFKFKTFAVPDLVTVFSVNLPWNNASSIATGWTNLQDWLKSGGMPAEMNMRLFANRFQTQLQGMYYGNSTELRTAIQPLLTKLARNGTSISHQSQEYDWMGAFSHYSYSQEIDLGHPYNQVETFYSKSLVTTELPAAAIQEAADYWISKARSNSRDWFLILDMYGGENSAITRVPNNATSYPYRGDYLFLYQFYDRVWTGSYPSNGFSFLDGWVKSITDRLTVDQWGMYINYADPTMSRKDAQDVYFRTSLDRLKQIKAQVDPTELFYYPQAVEPAK